MVGETAARGDARRQRSPRREPQQLLLLSCAALQPVWPEPRRPITRPPSCWSRISWFRVHQNRSWCVRNSTRKQTRFHNAHVSRTEIVAMFAQSLLKRALGHTSYRIRKFAFETDPIPPGRPHSPCSPTLRVPALAGPSRIRHFFIFSTELDDSEDGSVRYAARFGESK
jgi:hypothetical protein